MACGGEKTMMLADRQAIPQAQALYRSLLAWKGQYILLAQQESPMRGMAGQEMDFLQRVTGRLPAVRGLDFIHNDFDGCVARAKEWHSRGGLVTICWHTGVEGTGYPESQAESPDFSRLLTPGTPEHDLLLRRWDAAADALLQLQQDGIPVLWRPFHEFDGRWFWWGKGGPEHFITLWRMMFDHFTHVRGLHNLIWVLGYAGPVTDGWYPGDDVCDILGSDTYDKESTHTAAWERLRKLNAEKPLAFHECGVLPVPDAFFREGVVWSWVMPWHSTWLMQDNDEARLRAIYDDERYITLDKLNAMNGRQ